MQNLESTLIKDFLWQVRLKFQNGSCEEDFKTLIMTFRYFVIISPWKGAWPFIWTNVNPLPKRMLWAKIGWNLPGGSWKEDLNFVTVHLVSLFRNYFPFEKNLALYFKMNWTPFTQGCFVPSSVEIGQVVLEKKTLKFRQCIFTIS